MHKKTCLVYAALASLCAGGAVAEEMETFNGLSVGIQTGLHRNKAEITAPGNVALTDAAKGYALRGFAAYDQRLGRNFVVGGEIGAGRGGPTMNNSQGAVNFTADSDLAFDVSGRAGFVLGNRALLYGRAGYMNASIDIDAANPAATPTSLSSDKRRGGLMYGGGAEFAITEGLGLRAEYRRAKLGDVKSQQFLIGAVVRF